MLTIDMTSFFRAILQALPEAATSVWAFCAYGMTLITWAVIAWRVQRNRNLLERIESVPAADRWKPLQSEMEVPADIPREVWLRSKAKRYIFFMFVMGVGSAAVVIVVAIMNRAKVDQVRAADITATLTVDNGEQGNPCPPSFSATALRLLGRTRRV